jgi:hypothetical protein
MGRLPIAKFAIAQLHLFPLVIEHVKRLRWFGQELQIDEWRRAREHRSAAFNADIEKDVGRAEENEIGGEPESPKKRTLEDFRAAAI